MEGRGTEEFQAQRMARIKVLRWEKAKISPT